MAPASAGPVKWVAFVRLRLRTRADRRPVSPHPSVGSPPGRPVIATLSSDGATSRRVQVLPSDFALPGLPYLGGLLLAAVAVVTALSRRRPQVTEASVAALSPWMAAGGGMYALYQVDAVPAVVAPLFGSPAVYLTVAILAGTVWALAADEPADTWGVSTAPGILGVAGTVLLVATLAAATAWALTSPASGTTTGGPLLSGLILFATALFTAAVWAGLRRYADVSAVGLVGLIAVFGHTLDGVSTAVGYDVLGFGEQTPLSRLVIDLGAAVSPAWAGAGWLFVLVKLALAAAVVHLFEDFVREDPAEGYLLLAVVVAVGLGPGSHNLVLFAIA